MMIAFWIFLFLFVIVSICICFLVLIQSDKGGGISGAIGGGLGGANSLLGTQDTANILTRGTVIFGVGFFALCIIMSFLMTKQTYTAEKSMLQKRAEKQQSFSPSSVLDRGSLPIRSATEQGALPTGQPEAGHGVAPAQQSAVPNGQPLPTRSLPIGNSDQGPRK
ncbi:MAG: preprotein translocase subunit SecG [Chitinispirillaceae bacterium]|jgi:preprotein translocase subunit SecG